MNKLIRKNYFFIIFWFFFYFLIFGALFKNSYAYLDPDLGWHLKAGEHISLSGEVSRENFYNYTFSGNWINHEWLSDWGAYLIYNNFGYFVLSALFATLIVFILILLSIRAFRLSGSEGVIWIAVFQLMGVFASLPHFGVRIQEFSLLFLLIELAVFYQVRQGKSWRSLIWLLPLFLAWANIHGSFLFGLAIFLLFVLISGLELFLVRFNFFKSLIESSYLSWQNFFRLSLFFPLIIGATLVTPYGLEMYSFLSSYKNTAYLSLIQEWQPAYIFPIQYLKFFYLAILSSAWLGYIYKQYRAKQPINLWELILFLLFAALSFKSKRNFPLAFITTFPFFIKILSETLKWSEIKNFFGFKKYLYSLAIICLGLSGASLWLTTSFKSDPFLAFCNKYPCRAVNFLKKNPQLDRYKIFNEYGWGGYLIWTNPSRQLFIDGRLPQAEFAGHTFIEEYAEFFQAKTDLSAKLAEYNIRLILLRSKNENINIKQWEKVLFGLNKEQLEPKNRLRDYLEESSSWKIIYQDETARIYLRE